MNAKSPTEIQPSGSLQVWVFENLLRAFATGGATYADVQARLRGLLATGTSPTELLAIVRRTQLIEPLPESAQGVLDFLNDAIRREAGEDVVSAEAQDTEQQPTAYESPIRAYVPTREPEPAAAPRVTIPTAVLAAAQVALAAEQRRTRDLGVLLAEKSSVAEASRGHIAEILRDYERQQGEMRALRDSLAARDTTILQMQHSLDERDTRLAGLQQEHAKVVSTIEAYVESGARLEADIRAARAHAEVISRELQSSQEGMALLNAQLRRSESRLSAASAELGAVKTQSSSYLELIRTREWRRGYSHNMMRELDAQVGAANAGQRALETERDRLRSQLAAADSERARLAADLATRDRAVLQAEQASHIEGLRVEHAAHIERLQAEADRREKQIGVLTAELAARDLALLQAQERASRDAQSVVEFKAAADLRQAELAAQVAELRAEQAAQVERLQARGATRDGDAAADPGASVSEAADRWAALVRVDGDRSTYALTKRTRIGRAAVCELRIDSHAVSRHHALVVVGPRDTTIEDLNSTNGVLVNGKRVTRHELSDGDSLTIGDTKFRYLARLHNAGQGSRQIPSDAEAWDRPSARSKPETLERAEPSARCLMLP